jgi:hypothetical protein
MLSVRVLPLAVILTLTTTACPTSPSNPTPTSTVATVTVTGPSNGGLQLGEATTLTASAQDSSGKVIAAKTFAWTSSDPTVASVDASGVVTAKRFGSVTFQARVDGISGSSSSLKTYGLEAAGGTTITAGSSQVNTALLLRFRDASGGGANAAQSSLSLRGPLGWNGGNPYTFLQFFDGVSSYVVRPPGVKPLSGAYTLNATIGGRAYRASFALADATQTLATPANLTLSNLSVSSVTASWTAVPGVVVYGIQILNDTDKTLANGSTLYENLTSRTLDKLNLDKTTPYFFQVYAYNALVCCDKTFSDLYPAQFNEALSQVKITLP